MDWTLNTVSIAAWAGEEVKTLHRGRAGSRARLRGALPFEYQFSILSDLDGLNPVQLDNPAELRVGVWEGSLYRLAFKVQQNHVAAAHKVYLRQIRYLQYYLDQIATEAEYPGPLAMLITQQLVSNELLLQDWLGERRAYFEKIMADEDQQYLEDRVTVKKAGGSAYKYLELIDLDDTKPLYFLIGVDWETATEGQASPDPEKHEGDENYGFLIKADFSPSLIYGAGG